MILLNCGVVAVTSPTPTTQTILTVGSHGKRLEVDRHLVVLISRCLGRVCVQAPCTYGAPKRDQSCLFFPHVAVAFLLVIITRKVCASCEL